MGKIIGMCVSCHQFQTSRFEFDVHNLLITALHYNCHVEKMKTKLCPHTTFVQKSIFKPIVFLCS